MTAILYPVAANAELAMAAPLGRAAREREALGVAGEAVVFTTDPVGPAFATRDGAAEAYAGPVGESWARLAEQILPGQKLSPVKPVYADGRRWPAPAAAPPRTAWRLMVSYWRIATAERPIETPQARAARRARSTPDSETLRAMARQPLRPIEPQQPLDIGLFEVRPPDAPHIVMPDE
ncbi:hypothetical protein [Phenylobacterium sp.]|uniref:hypothetical protein n=1 Tax=Phenylobacterium sp. TaxID=1871053 RepID=UPI002C75ACB6|nr:hypothetical protein [Phenylobacterium sp.]HLZ74571.1 hypothetical protein [Phenylobacterium sp.]